MTTTPTGASGTYASVEERRLLGQALSRVVDVMEEQQRRITSLQRQLLVLTLAVVLLGLGALR